MLGFPRRAVVLALFWACICSECLGSTNVTYDRKSLILNGERKIIISGSIHYPRSTPEMWPNLISKAKEGGLDSIDTYIFWDVHEPRRRKYDFTGNLDFVKFFKLVQDAGLYGILRIGPYVCAEWNYGGFPLWLKKIPGIELRTDNQPFKDEMQNFTTLIVDMVKKANLLAPQGGPIILAQIENEYGNVMNKYGNDGVSYINWCAKMAYSLDIVVPWIMCRQEDAPEPMINTCNGFYCHDFMPNRPTSPKMWTENWTGWFKAWGSSTPVRPVEDIAYAVARFFESGGSMMNYYMYHGGTNFGRTSGGPFFVTSYDYDAPLDEYGNLRQPKWGHLKQLHSVLKSIEKVLTYGTSYSVYQDDVKVTKHTNATDTICFLANPNRTQANMVVDGNRFLVPAHSVSILHGCKQEIFNTAKVNTETSFMVKKPVHTRKGHDRFKWQWRPESLKNALQGKGSFEKHKLVNQLMTTYDTSDYLWYMTSVIIGKNHSSWADQMILQVNTTGHVLHAFFNGHLVGSQFGTRDNFSFVFEKLVNVKPGKNQLSLLSATVGLANYGAFFDEEPTGIIGGPVQLIGKKNITLNLSKQTWKYKVGLKGEDMKLYSSSSSDQWRHDKVPTQRPMTWYKSSFNVPRIERSLVLDLKGMGKGQAWINGHNLGRYWPSFNAPVNGCEICDYRRTYRENGCLIDCGQPSQRWYHVPKSFLVNGLNTLTMFEEFGGNPSHVSFQSVVLGSVRANAQEGSSIQLSCQGRIISKITIARFGNPNITCGSFTEGTCVAPNALNVIQKACIGKRKCSIDVSVATLGSNGCSNGTNTLVVEATC